MGSTVFLSVAVANVGQHTSPQTQVIAYYDGANMAFFPFPPLVGSQPLPGMESGHSADVLFEIPVDEVRGELLYIKVDPFNHVESSVTAVSLSRDASAYASECHPGSVTLTNADYSDKRLIRAETALTTAGNVGVLPGAEIILEAGTRIIFDNGFHVEGGSTLQAWIAPVSCAPLSAAAR